MQARLYPWAIGIPMVILALVQVILDLRGYKAKETSDGAPVDFQFIKPSSRHWQENGPLQCFRGCSVSFCWYGYLDSNTEFPSWCSAI